MYRWLMTEVMPWFKEIIQNYTPKYPYENFKMFFYE